MKKFGKFEEVKKALEQVVSESDVNNGTQGLELIAHYWSQEYAFDDEREKLRTDIARNVLQGNITEVKKLQAKMDSVEKPKIIMEFNLLTPIPRLEGTKVITDGERTYKLSMENVTRLFIPQDVVDYDLLEYDETEEKARDAQGREATIIKLRIKKGIIDVAAPIVDRFEKILRPKRAYVTAISFRAMQLVGQIANRERQAKRRRFGFDEQM